MTDQELLTQLKVLRGQVMQALTAVEAGRVISAHGMLITIRDDLHELHDEFNNGA